MTRIVMAGLGRAGETHARVYRTTSHLEVVGIAEPTSSRQTLARALFPHAQVAHDLASVTVDADLVIICTPPAQHAEDIRQALNRGTHVFCEKPAVLHPQTGIELADIAAARSRLLYPGHNYLFAQFARTMYELISAGHIGAIRHLRVEIDRPSVARGVDDWRPCWRQEPSVSGGGILVDHGTHAIYLAEALLNSHINAVSCVIDPPARDRVEHRATLRLRTHSGATATIRLSWTALRRHNRYVLYGERGIIDAHGEWIKLTADTVRTVIPVGDPSVPDHAHAEWLPDMVAEVIAGIAKPSTLAHRWAAAVTVAHTLRTAYMSAAERGLWRPMHPTSSRVSGFETFASDGAAPDA